MTKFINTVVRIFAPPPSPDYISLARKINKKDRSALELLDAYDRGEARIVNERLERV